MMRSLGKAQCRVNPNPQYSTKAMRISMPPGEAMGWEDGTNGNTRTGQLASIHVSIRVTDPKVKRNSEPQKFREKIEWTSARYDGVLIL